LWYRIDEDISGTAISVKLTDDNDTLINEFLNEDITIDGDIKELIKLYQDTYTSNDIAKSNDLNKFAYIFKEKIDTVVEEGVSFNIEFEGNNYTLEIRMR